MAKSKPAQIQDHGRQSLTCETICQKHKKIIYVPVENKNGILYTKSHLEKNAAKVCVILCILSTVQRTLADKTHVEKEVHFLLVFVLC